MTTTTNVQQVKVNKVTQAQYDSMTKNDNEFYVIVDKEYITSVNNIEPVNGNVTLPIPEDKLFVATYNSTSFSAIQTAYSNGKQIILKDTLGYNVFYVPLFSRLETTADKVSFVFANCIGNNIFEYTCKTTNGGSTYTWSYTATDLSAIQTVQNISDLTPTTGTTVNYTVSDGTSLYSLTPTGNITTIGFTYTGTDNKAYTFELILTLSTARTIGWNSNIHWLDGEIPDLSETGTYFLAFRKIGTSNVWYGNLQGKWN